MSTARQAFRKVHRARVVAKRWTVKLTSKSDAISPSSSNLVDHPLGVAVRARLLEVGEQLGSPGRDAPREGAEGRNRRTLHRGQKEFEAPLGLGAVACGVDRAKRFLQAPGLGQQRLGGEELAARAALALAQALARLEQSLAGPEGCARRAVSRV
jgi:hypothetical protein